MTRPREFGRPPSPDYGPKRVPLTGRPTDPFRLAPFIFEKTSPGRPGFDKPLVIVVLADDADLVGDEVCAVEADAEPMLRMGLGRLRSLHPRTSSSQNLSPKCPKSNPTGPFYLERPSYIPGPKACGNPTIGTLMV